ncbi:PaaX family transcriptional regulator [Catenuloplanes indicus]|uniref:Phenylacetic acid degradation operon negative regulatory protein n=1 Tax=Catenuloplanes indicus TaxID=137267 RepID=A0AAE4AWM6_9ACTN|nr:PaaX family transcriptional regulator C-terminal domain-containing protein [Catenuloplanes indicus]MDQ0364891.1 phenylacetic acid degradation operon negative regulatory protein [Catenuloplanes indicus]
MTSPYDIEEIFPEDAAGAVRLPRRQNGNSPQGLAVTLLADYTLRTRAWLPSAAVVALLGEAGVSPAGARTAISRLARRGVLEGARRGRQSSYRLTAAAAAFLTVGGRAIVSPAGVEPWDEHWTLVAFSLPQAETTRRRGLRTQLRWMGYAPLYDGLWVSPRALDAPAQAELERLAPGALTVFRARHAGDGRAPLEAWDVAAIAGEYAAFVARWHATPARPASGAEAVRIRTEVMDDYRRMPVLDPALPARLLPADWPREPARELFAAVYDGLAHTAERHVRDVAERVAGAPWPGIHAHTVAEMAAGLTG